MSKSVSGSSDKPNTGRRSFIWKTGAALSAVLATAVPAMSMPKFTGDKDLKGEMERLTSRLGSLEDESKIRDLHQALETNLDNGNYESLVELFSSDAEVRFNGGIFKGKERGIRRLFCGCFSSGRIGRRMVPAPGFEINDKQMQDKIEISKDRKSAQAQFSYSIEAGTPIISDSVLFKMARLQGGGAMKWWEGGIYRMACVKDMKDGSWKIKRLEYQALAKADYRPGKSYANPIDPPLFSKVYPDDPAGPDKLFKPVVKTQKV
jgi:hypothetical protein